VIKKILIIEDDKFLRELIAKKLRSENFEVLEAKNGEEGIKKSQDKESGPDLILLDLILPGISGFDALGEIKKTPPASEIPVIILSNLGQKDDVDKGMALGAVDFLIKAHFTPQEIVKKIKAVLK
jgi:DNA-binding response OmpR family regulator